MHVDSTGYPTGKIIVGVAPNFLEVGESEHVRDLSGGSQPSGGCRVCEAGPLGEAKDRLPQTAVAVDEQPRSGMAHRLQAFAELSDVVEECHDVYEQGPMSKGPRGAEDLGIRTVTFD